MADQPVTLEFIARQLQRVLDDTAEINAKLERHSLRFDMIEASQRGIIQRLDSVERSIDRFGQRLRRLEDIGLAP